MKKVYFVVILIVAFQMLSAQSNWKVKIGAHGFKYSLKNQPEELIYNPVFHNWEEINQNSDLYQINDYERLDPLNFNLTIGLDVQLRYKKYLMIKIGYDYSNSLGIGGKGNINYTNLSSGETIFEDKEFNYISHQFNCFIGPIIEISENGPELYMGFSMMSPTFVTYKEKYSKVVDNIDVRSYDLDFKGFFGNCRALIGMQVPVNERIMVGSDLTFSYFNGIELNSGNLVDQGFVFPEMKWDITFRYKLN